MVCFLSLPLFWVTFLFFRLKKSPKMSPNTSETFPLRGGAVGPAPGEAEGAARGLAHRTYRTVCVFLDSPAPCTLELALETLLGLSIVWVFIGVILHGEFSVGTLNLFGDASRETPSTE